MAMGWAATLVRSSAFNRSLTARINVPRKTHQPTLAFVTINDPAFTSDFRITCVCVFAMRARTHTERASGQHSCRCDTKELDINSERF